MSPLRGFLNIGLKIPALTRVCQNSYATVTDSIELSFSPGFSRVTSTALPFASRFNGLPFAEETKTVETAIST